MGAKIVSVSRRLISGFAAALVLGLAFANPGKAATFSATDQGWYDSSGLHHVGHQNFITGVLPGASYHDFFVFDLSSISGMTATSATLRISSASAGSYVSDDASEVFSIYDYLGSVADLVGGTGGTTAFNDLASGSSFGSLVLSKPGPSSALPSIDINLNAAGLADINNLLAGSIFDFAIGGNCSTCTLGQSIFSGSGNIDGVQLELGFTPISPTPLPAALPLFVTMLGGMGFLKWRRGKRQTV